MGGADVKLLSEENEDLGARFFSAVGVPFRSNALILTPFRIS